jgi:D-alanyl-D-alanine carboxypeptidase
MDRATIDRVMAPFVPEGGPGAAVGVVHRGETITAGYGLANVEWGVPIDPQTVFRIGSITKQFTAAAILRLVEQGRLALDDRIEKHLPDYPVGERTITVRQLLQHTSGIRSYTGLPDFFIRHSRKDLSLNRLIDLFKDEPADFAPGERYLYNNSGYVLLGAIIEAKSNQSYEAHLEETLFKPLGLAATRYLHDGPITPRRASGYAFAPGLVNAPMLSMNLPHAAGSLGSTVEDLLAWERALRGGQVVSAASYGQMTTPGRLNDGSGIGHGYGLAVHDYRGMPVVGHGGGINGFSSNLIHLPGEDLTVCVLSNVGGAPVQQVSYALARAALGLADVERKAVQLEEARLAACAGLYRLDGGPPFPLSVKDGALSSPFPQPNSVWRPMSATSFFLASDPEATLSFEDLQPDGYATVVIEAYGPALRAQRMAASPA